MRTSPSPALHIYSTLMTIIIQYIHVISIPHIYLYVVFVSLIVGVFVLSHVVPRKLPIPD